MLCSRVTGVKCLTSMPLVMAIWTSLKTILPHSCLPGQLFRVCHVLKDSRAGPENFVSNIGKTSYSSLTRALHAMLNMPINALCSGQHHLDFKLCLHILVRMSILPQIMNPWK